MNTAKFITSLCKLPVRYHLTIFIQFLHRISEKILLKVKGGEGIDKILCIKHNGNSDFHRRRDLKDWVCSV